MPTFTTVVTVWKPNGSTGAIEGSWVMYRVIMLLWSCSKDDWQCCWRRTLNVAARIVVACVCRIQVQLISISNGLKVKWLWIPFAAAYGVRKETSLTFCYLCSHLILMSITSKKLVYQNGRVGTKSKTGPNLLHSVSACDCVSVCVCVLYQSIHVCIFVSPWTVGIIQSSLMFLCLNW